MITTLFLLSVIIGIIIARIQFRAADHSSSLQKKHFSIINDIDIVFSGDGLGSSPDESH